MDITHLAKVLIHLDEREIRKSVDAILSGEFLNCFSDFLLPNLVSFSNLDDDTKVIQDSRRHTTKGEHQVIHRLGGINSHGSAELDSSFTELTKLIGSHL